MTGPSEQQPEQPSAHSAEVPPAPPEPVMPDGAPAEPKAEPPRASDGPVWRAALWGGIIGAVFSFVLARTFPVVPVPPNPPPSEARQFADQVIGALKDGRNDEFMALLRPAFAQMSDKDFMEFCQNVVFSVRGNASTRYGPGGQFEYFGESATSPTLVRVAYLEKYARGCLLWRLVVYNSPDGWQMSAFSLQLADSGFPMLQ